MKWQPIDTAPKDGNSIMVFVTGRHDETWIDVAYYNDAINQWMSAQNVVFPTHWMPLPPPPKE